MEYNQSFNNILDLKTASTRVQVIIDNFLDKAERLAYAAGNETEIKLIDPETQEAIKPFEQKSDRDMAKAYEKLLKEVVDKLQLVKLNAKSTEYLKTEVDGICNSLERSLEILEKLYTPVPATKVRLFQSEAIEPIPTGYPMRTSTICQLRHDLWQQDSNGIAFYRQESKRNRKNYIEHYITTEGDITLLPFNEAKQIIDKLGFKTAKLQLIFAAHAMDVDEPWRSEFTLKGTDIIRELGWNNRKDKTQAEQLMEIASTAFALDCLLVKLAWEEGINKKGKTIISLETSRMWNINIRVTGQASLLNGKIEQPNEVYLTVQPGLWTKGFLNRPGWHSKEALYQFGWLAQDVLRINPYHDELALRLAIHLTTESRIHESGDYRVRTLLEVAQPISEIEAARDKSRNSYDLKQRWDNALKLLMGLGWEITFDEQTYPEWLRPGNKERNKRGYFDKLLEAKIRIKPIPAIQARLAKLEHPKKISKPASTPKPSGLTASALRQAREAKGWTQTKLAGTLGISKQLVCHFESNRRTPSQELAARIRRVLDI
jgi:DNA-binding XRE family transcriptional regulator